MSIDPESVLGLGLSGKYLIEYGPASVRVGWKKRHCNAGTWLLGSESEVEDVFRYINKPGKYVVTFAPSRGSSVTIQGLQLKKGAYTLASSGKNKTIGSNSEGSFLLDVKKVAKKMILEVKVGSDSDGSGKIYIEPYRKLTNLSDIDALLK